MGYMKKIDKKYSEEDIQKALYLNFLSQSTKKYEMFNLFVFDWESDYLAITKSNYAYEVEIKITRSDFFNDFKHKGKKHLLLETREQSDCPNYFFYAVPKDLIKVEEVPEYAGLIYIDGNRCDVVKKPNELRKEPIDVNQLNLIGKFYYAYQNWRWKYVNSNINNLKAEIKALEKELGEYDRLLSEANCEISELKLKNI